MLEIYLALPHNCPYRTYLYHLTHYLYLHLFRSHIAVLDCFLEKQLQLFPEEVASTPEEAADFLEMCFAVVAKSKKEVRRYFEEVGTDIDGEDIFSASEVFPVGDGRYLIVEG